MKRLSIYVMLIFIILLLAGGCKKAMSPSGSSKDVMYEEDSSIVLNSSMSTKTKDDRGGKAQPGKTDNMTNDLDERKIIYRGDVDYRVKKLEGLEETVTKAVEKVGGYVSNSSFSTSSGYMEVKIPAEKFKEFMESIGSFGEVLSKQISAEDVTREFFDLEGRINSKRLYRKELEDYLPLVRNIEDVIRIKEEINEVTLEIERLEGSFKEMKHLISYSTLRMNISLPYVENVSKKWPSMTLAMKNFGRFVVNGLFRLVQVILYILAVIIIIGIPSVIIVGLLYYITFGKVGFVKKFFKLLTHGKQK